MQCQLDNNNGKDGREDYRGCNGLVENDRRVVVGAVKDGPLRVCVDDSNCYGNDIEGLSFSKLNYERVCCLKEVGRFEVCNNGRLP